MRGRDLCGDDDRQDGFHLAISGCWSPATSPTSSQLFFADAVLTAIAEHGLVPSVVAARMTYAAAPEAFQGAVAAGLLGCGSVVLGSAEACGNSLSDLVEGDAEGLDEPTRRERGVEALRAEKKAIPGFGHPLHAGGDPRAKLLARARRRARSGGAITSGMLQAVESALPEGARPSLPINVNGAIPAVMLDVGFPLQALKGMSLLARTASLIGASPGGERAADRLHPFRQGGRGDRL